MIYIFLYSYIHIIYTHICRYSMLLDPWRIGMKPFKTKEYMYIVLEIAIVSFHVKLQILFFHRIHSLHSNHQKPLASVMGTYLPTKTLHSTQLVLVISLVSMQVISPDDLAVLEGLTIPRLPPNALPQVVGFLVENDLGEHRMGPKTS